jgi:hypothetical protein
VVKGFAFPDFGCSPRFRASVVKIGFPISAMPGSPESPLLAFWGGMTCDYGDVGDPARSVLSV